jgi:hypothetical protein
MAKTVSDRIDHIRTLMSSALSGVLLGDADAKAARDAATDAKDATFSARENMIFTIAEYSRSEKWNDSEIDLACKAIMKANNDKSQKKSLETLTGEIKNAAHPLVRDHVKSLVAVAKEAWEDEQATKGQEGSKDIPRPVQQAFQRRYHVMTALFKQAKEGNVILTCEGLTEHANDVLLGRREDAAKVFKRLQGIVKELTAFHHDFRIDDIGLAIDTINLITEDELKSFIAAKQAERSKGDHPPEHGIDTAPTTTTVVDEAPETPVHTVEDEIDALLSGNLPDLKLVA